MPACFHWDNCSHDLLKQIKLNYNQIDNVGAVNCCPERIGEMYLNRSHCSTSCQSGVVDPSLESRDPPPKGKPTLPSMGPFTAKSAPSKVAQALNPDLHGIFDRSARPLAHFRKGANCDIRRLHHILSSGTPPPSTFNRVKWNCNRMRDADPASFAQKAYVEDP